MPKVDLGHSVRGIGFYVQELTKNLKGIKIVNKNPDIIHYTSIRPYFNNHLPIIKPKGVKIVATIHDLIQLVYPTVYLPGIKGRFWYFVNRLLIKNIDHFIAVSETTKKDIVRFWGIDSSKITVVYEASRSEFNKKPKDAGLSLPSKFALYVGDINYNKNIPNLIKACQIAKIPLVIAGKQAPEIEKMDFTNPELKHLENLDLSNVIRLGFVADSDLNYLYSRASVVVVPSFYEGFGLPAVEAHSAGARLAVSKTQVLTEVLGSEFIYFDPNNPKDMAEKILNPNANKKLPRKYSWQKCAKETTQVYISLMSNVK